jgi:hypothetical protein
MYELPDSTCCHGSAAKDLVQPGCAWPMVVGRREEYTRRQRGVLYLGETRVWVEKLFVR